MHQEMELNPSSLMRKTKSNLWDDRIYRKAINFARLSLTSVGVLFFGAAMHHLGWMILGASLISIFMGIATFLVFRMTWAEGDEK